MQETIEFAINKKNKKSRITIKCCMHGIETYQIELKSIFCI